MVKCRYDRDSQVPVQVCCCLPVDNSERLRALPDATRLWISRLQWTFLLCFCKLLPTIHPEQSPRYALVQLAWPVLEDGQHS